MTRIACSVAIGMDMRPRPRDHWLIDGDLIRVGDGSLRAVLECQPGIDRARTGRPVPDWIALLQRLDHPIQFAIRLGHRRHVGREEPAATPDVARARLRSSYDDLLQTLWPDRRVPSERLYVAVPCEQDARDRGEAVRTRLRDMGIETVEVSGSAMRSVVPTERAERRCAVLAGGRLARTLSLASGDAGGMFDVLRSTEAELDISIHVRPRSGSRVLLTNVLVTVWAATPDELEEITRCVDATLATRSIRVSRPHFEADAAFVSALPLALEPAGRWHAVAVRDLATMLASVFAARGRGVLLGIEPGSRRPLLLDRLAIADHDAIVLGSAGAGKSSLLAVELVRAHLGGTPVRVIDPQGAHRALVTDLGGYIVDVSMPFAPFSVRPGALGPHIACLAAIVELLIGELSDDQRDAIEDALTFAYASRGFADDRDTAGLIPPDIDDLAAVLASRASRAWGRTKAELDALLHGLAGSGEFFRRLLAAPRPQPDERDVTAYDLRRMPDEFRPAATMLALDHAFTEALSARRPTLVVADDIDELASRPLAARHLARLLRSTDRPQSVGLRLAASRVPADIYNALRDGVQRGTLAVLMRQTENAAAELAGLLHLTPAEQSWLVDARAGEGLLVLPDRRLAFEVAMSDEERRLITRGGDRP